MILFLVLVSFVLILIFLIIPFQIEFNSNYSFITIRFFYLFTYNFSYDVFFYQLRNTSNIIQFEKKRLSKWNKILATFKVKKLDLSVDTGNNQLNSFLFPVFYLLGFFLKRKIQINYTGNNFLKIILQNNLARLSWAFISSK